MLSTPLNFQKTYLHYSICCVFCCCVIYFIFVNHVITAQEIPSIGNESNNIILARPSQPVTEGSLRLVDGRTPHEGNVQIFHRGKWGSICDDGWDEVDAAVVCRQLGYIANTSTTEFNVSIAATNMSHFGNSSEHFWLNNVYCTGQERKLKYCWHWPWGVHDCEPNEAAGVICAQLNSLADLFSNLVSKPVNDSIQPEMTTTSTTQTELTPAINSTQTELTPTTDSTQTAIKPTVSTQTESTSPHVSRHLSSSELLILSPNDPRSRLTNGIHEVEVRLAGGVSKDEGRVEIRSPETSGWGLICSDGWTLLEATVVCRQLGKGYARKATQTAHIFGGSHDDIVAVGVRCTGQENTLAECDYLDLYKAQNLSVACPGNQTNIAGVICTTSLPDLVPDPQEVRDSLRFAYTRLGHLECAMEENCLASSAYRIKENQPKDWQSSIRKLLRFKTTIHNIGNADFLPAIPKDQWTYHECHQHYHSMEVFAIYDILDSQGRKMAEGHKASFCLEDNNCIAPPKKRYVCAHKGDQGISPGCADIYAANIDCQWIDITDLEPGNYTLKIIVNGEMKVPEMDFSNNAVICDLGFFEGDEVDIYIDNCTNTGVERPDSLDQQNFI